MAFTSIIRVRRGPAAIRLRIRGMSMIFGQRGLGRRLADQIRDFPCLRTHLNIHCHGDRALCVSSVDGLNGSGASRARSMSVGSTHIGRMAADSGAARDMTSKLPQKLLIPRSPRKLQHGPGDIRRQQRHELDDPGNPLRERPVPMRQTVLDVEPLGAGHPGDNAAIASRANPEARLSIASSGGRERAPSGSMG